VRKHVYLCGPIEDVSDGGTKWRERITPDLEKLGLIVFDPTTKESEQFQLTVEEHKERLAKMKEAGQLEEFNKIMSAIVKQDLDAVRDSKFIVALVPDREGAQIGGTVHEIAFAWENKIPILWKCNGNPSGVNSWLLSLLIDDGTRFDTWISMMDHIKKEYVTKK